MATEGDRGDQKRSQRVESELNGAKVIAARLTLNDYDDDVLMYSSQNFSFHFYI